MQFAHMKRILKLDRLRLRGLSGAKDEVLLTATAQNLRLIEQRLVIPSVSDTPHFGCHNGTGLSVHPGG
jgi:hypothetical protein